MYEAHNKMDNANNKLPENNAGAPTLQQLIRSLGDRTNIVAATRQRLAKQGHEYTNSAIYSTIQKNGTNNATIAAALLDAIESQQATNTALEARKLALAA